MQPRPNQRSNAARVLARGLIPVLLLLAGASFAYASTTSGSIDSAHKYAWDNVGGFVNFAPTQGGLTITDSALTGYAWASNTGWISFSTTQSGVTNNGNGTLGGFAWSQGEGWLSFTGVTIDSSGQFHGTATSATSTLTFNCTQCDVRTDWRPASSRPSTSSGGGGSISPIITPSPTATSSNPSSAPSLPPTTPGTPLTPHNGTPGSALNTANSSGSYGQATSGTSVHATTSTHTATTTPFSTKAKSFFHTVAIPAGIVLLLVLAFFVLRFFF